MFFTQAQNWPLTFVCVAMIVAAVIDGWKLKVPNWLNFPLIISGWLLGILHDCNVEFLGSAGEGGIGGALVGTLLGFALLFPVYAIGGMGGGDVKMQMGFGSWVGAFYGISHGASVIFYAFLLAVVIGGVMAVIMMTLRGQWNQNAANTQEILADLLGGKSVEEISGNAKKRKSRLHLLPYGIPLCLGFLGYLVAHTWN